MLLAEHLRALIKEGREFDEVCEEMLRYRHHTHLLFSLESLANLARNGRIKPTVAAVARMLNIRVIGKASDVGELDVLCRPAASTALSSASCWSSKATATRTARSSLPTAATPPPPSA